MSYTIKNLYSVFIFFHRVKLRGACSANKSVSLHAGVVSDALAVSDSESAVRHV